MSYQVGLLNKGKPKEYYQVVGTIKEAMRSAIAIERSFNEPIGIWYSPYEGSELRHILFDGWLWDQAGCAKQLYPGYYQTRGSDERNKITNE